MKVIIVPTDFSPASSTATHYAADMAKDIGAALHLVHVYQVPVAVSDVPVVLVSVEELRKNAEEQLENLQQGLQHVTSGEIKITAEAILGNTVDELEEVCKKIKPFAVVMGNRGSTGMERILFGSTTLSTIRHLTWPVIAVPAGSRYQHITKIGFACDFRKVVESTPTEVIRDFVETFGASLHVLNVDHDHKHFKPGTPEESLLLHNMIARMDPQYHFIDAENIDEGINRFAEENKLDLVITIPKKHNLLDGLFKKHSTRQLVYASHVPVMCIHE